MTHIAEAHQLCLHILTPSIEFPEICCHGTILLPDSIIYCQIKDKKEKFQELRHPLNSLVVHPMADRGFNEIDLRRMLEDVKAVRPSHVSGRYVAECSRARRLWHVVVEPDEANRLVLVVTAYRVEVKR